MKSLKIISILFLGQVFGVMNAFADSALQCEETINSMSAGERHTCVNTSNQNVYCWGRNEFGQLGDGTKQNRDASIKVVDVEGGSDYLEGITNISEGGKHSCAVSAQNVYCWGSNSDGQLGNNTQTDSLIPVKVKGVSGNGYLQNISQVSVGEYFSCALSTSGNVYCWGRNQNGQLGNGTTSASSAPVQVINASNSQNETFGGISKISAGGDHVCALTTNKEVYCWGSNSFHQLGVNGNENQKNPVKVVDFDGDGNLGNIVDIASGILFTCALDTNKHIYCFGYGYDGQLGNNGTLESYIPVQVKNPEGTDVLENVSGIFAGGISFTVCATTVDGKAYCWGKNDYGQVGNGSKVNAKTPAMVAGPTGVGTNLKNVVSISTGVMHACALTSDNSVYCWGSNESGQLGNDTNIDSYIPVLILRNGCQSATPTQTFTPTVVEPISLDIVRPSTKLEKPQLKQEANKKGKSGEKFAKVSMETFDGASLNDTGTDKNAKYSYEIQLRKVGRNGADKYKILGRKATYQSEKRKISIGNLDKGEYSIRYRVKIVSGKKNAYTKWTERRSVVLK